MDNSQLPSASDLEKLPRRAIVAFAARCARTVLPILERSWSNASEGRVRVLAEAVRVAEVVGAAGHITVTETRAAADAAAAAAADAAADAARARRRTKRRRAATLVRRVDAAAHAAAAAVAAAAVADDADAAADFAAQAARAAHAAAQAARAGRRTMRPRILADWVKIRDAAAGWKEDVSVPPSFFDAIETLRTEGIFKHGRDGRARSVERTRPVSTRALEIVLEFPSDASGDEIDKATAKVVSAADALHRARGGHGLVLDSLQAEQPAAAEVSA